MNTGKDAKTPIKVYPIKINIRIFIQILNFMRISRDFDGRKNKKL